MNDEMSILNTGFLLDTLSLSDDFSTPSKFHFNIDMLYKNNTPPVLKNNINPLVKDSKKISRSQPCSANKNKIRSCTTESNYYSKFFPYVNHYNDLHMKSVPKTLKYSNNKDDIPPKSNSSINLIIKKSPYLNRYNNIPVSPKTDIKDIYYIEHDNLKLIEDINDKKFLQNTESSLKLNDFSFNYKYLGNCDKLIKHKKCLKNNVNYIEQKSPEINHNDTNQLIENSGYNIANKNLDQEVSDLLTSLWSDDSSNKNMNTKVISKIDKQNNMELNVDDIKYSNINTMGFTDLLTKNEHEDNNETNSFEAYINTTKNKNSIISFKNKEMINDIVTTNNHTLVNQFFSRPSFDDINNLNVKTNEIGKNTLFYNYLDENKIESNNFNDPYLKDIDNSHSSQENEIEILDNCLNYKSIFSNNNLNSIKTFDNNPNEFSNDESYNKKLCSIKNSNGLSDISFLSSLSSGDEKIVLTDDEFILIEVQSNPASVNLSMSSVLSIKRSHELDDIVNQINSDDDKVEGNNICLSNPSNNNLDSNATSSDIINCTEYPESNLPYLIQDVTKLTNDELRNTLNELGIRYGPVTLSTRKILEKRLKEYLLDGDNFKNMGTSVEFSSELEIIISGKFEHSEFDILEKKAFDIFNDTSIGWREGKLKHSFIYLLLDPLISNDLPSRVHILGEELGFRIFLKSIFYVGKGKQSRPYDHLREAAKFCLKKNNVNTGNLKKIRHIANIWASDNGVIILMLFHNIRAADAYTREACIIEAIGLEKLTNACKGKLYGPAEQMSIKNIKKLGAWLLKKSFIIFCQEGERQIKLKDLRYNV